VTPVVKKGNSSLLGKIIKAVDKEIPSVKVTKPVVSKPVVSKPVVKKPVVSKGNSSLLDRAIGAAEDAIGTNTEKEQPSKVTKRRGLGLVD